MNGDLSDSSTFLADGLRGGDLPAGVGVGDAETIAAITSNSALTFGIIAFMYFTFFVVCCCVERDCSRPQATMPRQIAPKIIPNVFIVVFGQTLPGLLAGLAVDLPP
jgi:hypothetical protein